MPYCWLTPMVGFQHHIVALKGNFDSNIDILSVVPITFRFTIPLLDVVADRLHLLETSRQIFRDHFQQFDFFQVVRRIHDEKYHPCPLNNLCYH